MELVSVMLNFIMNRMVLLDPQEKEDHLENMAHQDQLVFQE